MSKHHKLRLLIIVSLFFMNHEKIVASTNFSLPHITSFMIGNSLITVDAYTYVSSHMYIKEFGEGACLNVGKFSSIADNVIIFLGGNHRVDWITTYPFNQLYFDTFGAQDIVGHPATNGDVHIGNDVWIGSNVTIMSGICIGNGAVIATGSVVTHDVEPYSIVGGNPAKHIRYRFEQETRKALEKLRWWDLDVAEIKELVYDLCAIANTEKIYGWIKKYREDV